MSLGEGRGRREEGKKRGGEEERRDMWFSMSPLPRLHHHDIMTIVELFFIYIPFVTSCNVGALKTAQCTAVVSSAL